MKNTLETPIFFLQEMRRENGIRSHSAVVYSQFIAAVYCKMYRFPLFILELDLTLFNLKQSKLKTY